MKYIAALDQGTTSSRAVVFNENQEILSIAQKELTQIYPHPGYVEHDPMEIYNSQLEVLEKAINLKGIAASDIAAIGITNQRETTIVWDRHTGLPVYNAIVWQCRRTSSYCEDILAKGLGPYIKQATGLVVDAYFSATKIMWILDNVPMAREKAENGDLLFGTVDTWLAWKLSGGNTHVTDYTNASRTMLYNIDKLCWDEKLLAEFKIPACMLPEVKTSSETYCATSVLGCVIPVAGIAGDQQAALFGQCCFDKGEAKNTYGTGCFLLANTGNKHVVSNNGLITTIAASFGGDVQYALEGSVFVAGAVIQWLRDELKIIPSAAASEQYAISAGSNGGVYIVPAFSGLGAPYWDMYARGAILGITRGTNQHHFARAALESIAYQTKDVLGAMAADMGSNLSQLKVDGGASSNNFLMQFQADILDIEILRPMNTEATALGAAYLAGLAIGFWKDTNELKQGFRVEKLFSPSMGEQQRIVLLDGWQRAVERSRGWENH
ncbi:MAG: glycerol kinase GlpK [Eubacteriaceae bacterium]|nr:glycerol kinase GlpK [Eubacteriaceae bacterium]